MSENHEINDNEICVIEGKLSETVKEPGLSDLEPEMPRPRRRSLRMVVALIVGALLIGAVLVFATRSWLSGDYGQADSDVTQGTEATATDDYAMMHVGGGVAGEDYATKGEESGELIHNSPSKGYTEMIDTVIDGKSLTLCIPHDAKPELVVGVENYNDTTCAMMMQAADVRGDNGEINCAFVLRGSLLARGESKAGYCAIIDGKTTVGVERYSPLLEQAIEKGGDFFRQYPLVAGGQPLKNTLRYRSVRRALVQMDGTIMVVMGKDRMTLDEFASLLSTLGVEQAIYLTGSKALGRVKLKDGSRYEIGERQHWRNISFIVWR